MRSVTPLLALLCTACTALGAPQATQKSAHHIVPYAPINLGHGWELQNDSQPKFFLHSQCGRIRSNSFYLYGPEQRDAVSVFSVHYDSTTRRAHLNGPQSANLPPESCESFTFNYAETLRETHEKIHGEINTHLHHSLEENMEEQITNRSLDIVDALFRDTVKSRAPESLLPVGFVLDQERPYLRRTRCSAVLLPTYDRPMQPLMTTAQECVLSVDNPTVQFSSKFLLFSTKHDVQPTMAIVHRNYAHPQHNVAIFFAPTSIDPEGYVTPAEEYRTANNAFVMGMSGNQTGRPARWESRETTLDNSHWFYSSTGPATLLQEDVGGGLFTHPTGKLAKDLEGLSAYVLHGIVSGVEVDRPSGTGHSTAVSIEQNEDFIDCAYALAQQLQPVEGRVVVDKTTCPQGSSKQQSLPGDDRRDRFDLPDEPVELEIEDVPAHIFAWEQVHYSAAAGGVQYSWRRVIELSTDGPPLRIHLEMGPSPDPSEATFATAYLASAHRNTHQCPSTFGTCTHTPHRDPSCHCKRDTLELAARDAAQLIWMQIHGENSPATYPENHVQIQTLLKHLNTAPRTTTQQAAPIGQ